MRKNVKRKWLLALCMCSTVVVAGGVNAFSNQASATDAVIQGQTDTVSLVAGAACRVDSSESSGLRFIAAVNKAEYAQFQTQYEETNVSAGMMIVPQETVALLDEYTITALSEKVDFSTTQCFGETQGFRTATVNDEESYVFSKTLVTKEANYTRKFVARAYIKIVAESGIDALSNADYYDGAYYLYSDYSMQDNVRSVYEVAKAAYNDRLTSAERDTIAEQTEYDQLIGEAYSPYTQEHLDNVKVFLDGVADIKSENSQATIANNTDYYTSPYTLTQANNGVALIDVSVNAPIAMQYNGEREADLTVTDETVSVGLFKANNASVSANGLSFNNGNGATQPDESGAQWSQYWNWFSFIGDYGVGTYVDFSFTGNHMPQLIFFADNADPYATTASTGKGVFLTNGYGWDTTTFTKMQAFGPNRLSGNTYGGNALFTLEKDYYPELTAVGLSENSTKSYDYMVGTFTGSDGNVGMHILLKDATTSETIYEVRKSLNLTAEQVGTGNIVVLAPFGGSQGQQPITAFSIPYAYTPTDISYTKDPFVHSGATFNGDGTVTLAGVGFFGPSNASELWNSQFGYIGFNGNYGVGYTMEFTFTGLNIPDVILFAGAVDGYKSSMGGSGMLLTAGIGPCNHDVKSSYFRVYGMNRVAQNTNYDWVADDGWEGYDGNLNATLLGSTGGTTYADYPLLTQAGLSGSTDTYKYVVTTKLNAEDKIVVVVSLYQKLGDEFVEIENVNGAEYTNLEITTTFTEADIKGTNIIVQSTGIGGAWAPACTFSYVAPYKVVSGSGELF